MAQLSCDVPGCTTARCGPFTKLCSNHRNRQRRHGDVNQKAITVDALKPFARWVRQIIRAQPNTAEIDAALATLWEDRVLEARRYLAEFEAGRAKSRVQVRAYQELVRVAEDVPADKIVDTVAGMQAMMERHPRRFASDRAYWQQVCRRVRGLTDLSAIRRYSPTEDRIRFVYRDIPAKAATLFGQMCVVTLGEAGTHCNRLEQEEAERPRRARAALRRAMGGGGDEAAAK
jgi:hypothetical protein